MRLDAGPSSTLDRFEKRASRPVVGHWAKANTTARRMHSRTHSRCGAGARSPTSPTTFANPSSRSWTSPGWARSKGASRPILRSAGTWTGRRARAAGRRAPAAGGATRPAHARALPLRPAGRGARRLPRRPPPLATSSASSPARSCGSSRPRSSPTAPELAPPAAARRRALSAPARRPEGAAHHRRRLHAALADRRGRGAPGRRRARRGAAQRRRRGRLTERRPGPGQGLARGVQPRWTGAPDGPFPSPAAPPASPPQTGASSSRPSTPPTLTVVDGAPRKIVRVVPLGITPAAVAAAGQSRLGGRPAARTGGRIRRGLRTADGPDRVPAGSGERARGPQRPRAGLLGQRRRCRMGDRRLAPA